MGSRFAGGSALRWMGQVLMGIGAVVFLVGDGLLRVFWNVSFVVALIVGVVSGLGICAIGWVLKSGGERS